MGNDDDQMDMKEIPPPPPREDGPFVYTVYKGSDAGIVGMIVSLGLALLIVGLAGVLRWLQ